MNKDNGGAQAAPLFFIKRGRNGDHGCADGVRCAMITGQGFGIIKKLRTVTLHNENVYGVKRY